MTRRLDGNHLWFPGPFVLSRWENDEWMRTADSTGSCRRDGPHTGSCQNPSTRPCKLTFGPNDVGHDKDFSHFRAVARISKPHGEADNSIRRDLAMHYVHGTVTRPLVRGAFPTTSRIGDCTPMHHPFTKLECATSGMATRGIQPQSRWARFV
ncbi:uncharacterized protein B0I36DRAFT_334142 [Microdochium trichocladiopsis]|uniref:Uncharacterized protein n=1 Tax=Microdochium trichocladiopsis TaxID=1682393 RepID=A0A9P8XWM1_9PEZI|nr:uncharacterized protein B0I36DRAFT_334142 [Microdochium trichocladiopsis]KAH7021261.1 hypothetical protein B0I36DRAFT_334142 [Microdochium trichocladiopsis]